MASNAGYYDWLNFNSPISDYTADRLVRLQVANSPSTILDVGCGWGELLLRLLTACPEAKGHGIDHDEALIKRAESNAEQRGLTDRVRFSPDAGAAAPADLVVNVGAEHVFGTADDALLALWDLVHPGGHLLFGYQFWERPPSAEVKAFIGDLPDLPQLLAKITDVGWRPLDFVVSSVQEWDEFESGYMRDWEEMVLANGDTAVEARRRADEQRAGYLQRRGVLGFALLTLGRPADT